MFIPIRTPPVLAKTKTAYGRGYRLALSVIQTLLSGSTTLSRLMSALRSLLTPRQLTQRERISCRLPSPSLLCFPFSLLCVSGPLLKLKMDCYWVHWEPSAEVTEKKKGRTQRKGDCSRLQIYVSSIKPILYVCFNVTRVVHTITYKKNYISYMPLNCKKQTKKHFKFRCSQHAWHITDSMLGTHAVYRYTIQKKSILNNEALPCKT